MHEYFNYLECLCTLMSIFVRKNAETVHTGYEMGIAFGKIRRNALKGEKLKLNMNDYMSVKFPASYAMAQEVCKHLEKQLHHPLDEVEIGYLAMHIERVVMDKN